MGLLTESAQKAVLCFNGNPLISHVLDTVLREPTIGEVVVLTGCRGNDIHQILRERYPNEMRTGTIRILDFPNIQGTLSRLTSALPQFNASSGWCVCGIDSLVPQTVFHRFCAFVAQHKEEIILSFSPRLEIAPTHKVGCIQGNHLTALALHSRTGESRESNRLWCTDVGIRYFPPPELRGMRQREFPNGTNIPSYIIELLDSGKIIRAFLFEENWRHFASLGDFYGSEVP